MKTADVFFILLIGFLIFLTFIGHEERYNKCKTAGGELVAGKCLKVEIIKI